MTDHCNQDRAARLQTQQQRNYAACRQAFRELPQAIAMFLLVTALAFASLAASFGLVLALLVYTNTYTMLAAALILFLTGGLLAFFAPSIELYFLHRRGQTRRS